MDGEMTQLNFLLGSSMEHDDLKLKIFDDNFVNSHFNHYNDEI